MINLEIEAQTDLTSMKNHADNGRQGRKIRPPEHSNTEKEARNYEKLEEAIISTLGAKNSGDKSGI
jgi:hypothetical protein